MIYILYPEFLPHLVQAFGLHHCHKHIILMEFGLRLRKDDPLNTLDHYHH